MAGHRDGCHYATSGGSLTSTNDSANDAGGLTSDPGALPCCSTSSDSTSIPLDPEILGRSCNATWDQDRIC